MSSELEPEHLRKVFIGGLHPDTTDESMKSYFSKYGEIVDCIVMKDSQTRRSRGFGFVAFDRSTCVDQLQGERPHYLEGKEVDTKRVVPKASNTQPRSDREQKVNKVFMGGLRDEITEDDMHTFFGQFGMVERVETFMDKNTNKRKGFAFITFKDFDSVDKCVLQAQTAPDGKMNLQGVKVEVKKAKSQDEMKGGMGGRGGGGRGGGGRGGDRDGGYNRGGSGFGDQGGYGGGGGGGGYNQGGYGGGNSGGGGGGYNNQSSGFGGSSGGGFGGGGNYNNQGGFGGGGDAYNGGGYNNGGSSGGGGGGWSNQQQGGWGGNSGGGGGSSGGGYQNSSSMGGGFNNGGYGGSGGSSGGGGGNSSNSGGGGGPMRTDYNKNRSEPYGGGGGGGGGGGSSSQGSYLKTEKYY